MSMYYIYPMYVSSKEKAEERTKEVLKSASTAELSRDNVDMWQAFEIMHRVDGTRRGRRCDCDSESY